MTARPRTGADEGAETAPVEFPGGRVEVQRLPPQSTQRLKTAMAARVQGTRLVLDRLAELRAGANPDAEGRPLPGGLGRLLDGPSPDVRFVR